MAYAKFSRTVHGTNGRCYFTEDSNGKQTYLFTFEDRIQIFLSFNKDETPSIPSNFIYDVLNRTLTDRTAKAVLSLAEV